MTISEVLDFMNRGFKIGKLIQARLEQIKRLDALARQVTPVYGTEAVARSRRTDSRENVIVKLTDARAELEKTVDDMIRAEREIRNVISCVPDVDCRLVLEFRFLDMNTWTQITQKLDMDKSHVFRIRKKALQMAAAVLEAERRMKHGSGSEE